MLEKIYMYEGAKYPSRQDGYVIEIGEGPRTGMRHEKEREKKREQTGRKVFTDESKARRW
jgi:hypothetical protein